MKVTLYKLYSSLFRTLIVYHNEILSCVLTECLVKKDILLD